jgi:hypothetical protein
VTKVILPGERGNAYPDGVGELEIPEILYEIDTIAEDFRGRRGWIRESTIKKKQQQATSLPIVMATALHPMGYVGIDTCNGNDEGELNRAGGACRTVRRKLTTAIGLWGQVRPPTNHR